MARRKLPDLEMVEADARGIEIGFERMAGILARLPDIDSHADLVKLAPGLIAAAVRRIEDAAEPFDAFDVLESLKMRELPMSLVGYSEREHDGMPAVIELAAVVLLARGAREAHEPSDANPGEAVEQIAEAARELLFLANFVSLTPPMAASAGSSESAAKAEIAQSLKTYELFVRNRQYQSIRDEHDPKLLGDDQVSRDMTEMLGFSYTEYIAIRRAIHEFSGDRLNAAADQFYGAFDDEAAAARWDFSSLPEDTRERAWKGLANLFIHPGARASFTADEIAVRSESEVSIVRAVLTLFAVPFDSGDPASNVRSYLEGDNPFSSKSLLVDAAGNYLSTGAQLGDDMVRTAVEKGLSEKAKARYVGVRTRVSEGLAGDYFGKMIGPAQKFTGLKYWAPAAGEGPEVVAQDETDVRSSAKQTEMDCLIVAEDVAICVEVKGAGLRKESRGGNAVKLASDLAKTVGEAASQADRARALIEANHGLHTPSGWLSLDGVREVHCVVVTLEDLGPAGIALDAMVRAGVVTTQRVPWIVSLHDLAVISRLVEEPAELLLYLRRRTSPTFAQVFHAVDELDLFMSFLSDGLFLEDDPDVVAAANPAAPPATAAERRRFQRSLVPKTVATHTDPLDQWMYAAESGGATDTNDYPKPTFRSEARIAALVNSMTRDRKPGWLRAGADLLAFSGDAQSRIANAIERTAAATRADGKWHNAFMSQMSAQGHFGLFIGSVPLGMSVAKATTQLERYARVKVHQVHADRSLGLVVSSSGEIVNVGYGNHEREEDPALDALTAQMSLTSVARMSRSMPPPSARRTTVRLRGKAKGKKRKR
ncbi:hypothetical protein BKA24_001490 [Microbacterium marinum]|uniref:Preprotein translocase subunit SecA n=1 Tax=Microbacterium marinum TaxID=421115 RepID=A0A7W7BS34_9MICO|nr:hypothetical protein [Microbacterium marinum]MBB4666781.1 hypothetical protein [Microbacterium marinum]